MNSTLSDRYFTVEQAAKRLNVTPRQMQRLCESGYIGERWQGIWHIHKPEFEEFRDIVRPASGRHVNLRLAAWRASVPQSELRDSR